MEYSSKILKTTALAAYCRAAALVNPAIQDALSPKQKKPLVILWDGEEKIDTFNVGPSYKPGMQVDEVNVLKMQNKETGDINFIIAAGAEVTLVGDKRAVYSSAVPVT